MTVAQQTAAPERTDEGGVVDRRLLLEFAELDELFVDTKASSEQIRRLAELSIAIAGPDYRGENVGAVLARRLAAAQYQLLQMHGRLEEFDGQADRILALVEKHFGSRPEKLGKDGYLAILPSGNAISLRGILEARFVGATGGVLILFSEAIDHVRIDDPTDVAALRAALHRVGVSINAPTIAGEDRDGDGRTGE